MKVKDLEGIMWRVLALQQACRKSLGHEMFTTFVDELLDHAINSDDQTFLDELDSVFPEHAMRAARETLASRQESKNAL